MAIDKAVDSAQLNAALTATANAIREKAGNSDACPWDASTGFASLIAAIQAGGGGAKVANGTLNGSNVIGAGAHTTTPVEIEHGLGVVPDVIVVFDVDGTGKTPTGVKWGLYAALYRKGITNTVTVVKTAESSGSNLNVYTSTSVVGISNVTAGKFSIGGKYAYPLGHTYVWIAVAGLSA